MTPPPGGQLEPQGHGWQDFHSEPLCIVTYFGLHGFIKDFLKFTPLHGANLDFRGIGMVGTIYVEDHQTLLYTKYISCGPHGHLSFSHYMSESY